tara:strand:- start:1420 stop:2181 length:762 start_codon:yes stop_codon:yes gene_type:complete
MYNRKNPFIRSFSQKEFYNLNNKFVMLLPPWQEIKRRYDVRGDEIHNLSSLRKVYDMFDEEHRKKVIFPNVIELIGSNIDVNAGILLRELESMESLTLRDISEYIQKFVEKCHTKEAPGLNFTIYDDGAFLEDDPDVMFTKGEEAYYKSIKQETLKKISNEILGINEYNRKQDMFSRRFIHTNDSCISFIHAMFRDGNLNIDFVLRSSDVKNTFHHDLKFLYHLSKCVYSSLPCDNIEFIKMRFTLNSAHILD